MFINRDTRRDYLDNLKKEVVFKNDLIEAKFNLTALEQKLIVYSASLIKCDDGEFKTFIIKASDFFDFLGTKATTRRYVELKKVADLLFERVIFTRTEKGNLKKLRWISTCTYMEREGAIKLKFNEDLKEFLLNLRGAFTILGIENIKQLNSKYSFRFYSLFKANLYKNKIQEYDLEDIKFKLDLLGKYKVFSEFKRRVIEVSMKEINKYTDIQIQKVEYIKTGRKVTGARFYIDYNSKNEIALSMDKESLIDIEKQAGLQDFNFTEKQLEELYITACETVGENPYIEVYEYMKMTSVKMCQGTGIKNQFGFYKRALKEDYYKIKNQIKMSI